MVTVPSRPVRIALLHSPLLTAAATWGGLPGALTRLGHEVTVVSVTEDATPPYVAGYAHSAARQLPRGPLALVAHSGAGPLVPVVAARLDLGEVAAAVFLDAGLPSPDESRLGMLHAEDPERGQRCARELYRGGRLPAWRAEDLDVPEPAAVLAGLRPRGLDFFTETIPLPSSVWTDLPWAYLRTSQAYDGAAERAERLGRPVLRRGGGHLAAHADPKGVAADVDLLLRRLLE